VTAQRAVSVPDEVDLETAAAVMLQGMTAHYLANSTHPLGEDDVAVVWAAAGGVGRLLVQMAKHRGARVIACTSTQDKADEVVRLGADDVLLYRDVDVPAEIRRLTGGKGADVVYDSVGRDTFDVSLQLLRPRGLLVSFGQSSGPIEPLSVLRLSAAGSLFLTRPKLDDYTASVSEREWRASAVFDAITLGRLDVAIHDRYPLADAVEAHRALESGTTTGKLLLTV
ncbi:MAG: quinone oxidoreductase, partial [Nitriliruptoraceae bacterium]